MNRHCLLATLLMAFLGPSAGEAQLRLPAVRLEGPATARPEQVVIFAGSLGLDGIGLPQQTIELLVDGTLVNQTQTDVSGVFTVPHTFGGAGNPRVEAVWAHSTPVEARSDPLAVIVGQDPVRPPTSQELIARDLSAGTIDYATALLYRLYALFWDPRLPAAYDGAGSDGEDPGLFHEIEAALPTLSETERAALEPFLVRPDDPRSVFGPASSSPPAAAATGSARLAAAAAGEAPATRCPTQWIGIAGAHFTVWACTSSDPVDDGRVTSRVLAEAELLWPEMTSAPPAGMGPPLPDINVDETIDIYVLATNQCREREGKCEQIDGNAVAAAVAAIPKGSLTNSYGIEVRSGYILIDRNRVDSPKLKPDLIHEFFHVLQFAHNRGGTYSHLFSSGNKHYFHMSWFVEASATWAEWQYAPDLSRAAVHYRFPNDFQPSRKSLLTSDGRHTYASYIWPFFAQQEKNGPPDAIFQAWVDAERASDPSGVDDAVDQQLGFEDHFRDFSVRNLNLELPGDPINPMYRDQAPGPLADTAPLFTNVDEIRLESTPFTAVGINVLAAQYDHFTFAPDVRGITFDFSRLRNADNLDVDVIANFDDGWKRISLPGSRLELCRDLPEQNAHAVYLILSNHSRARDSLGGLPNQEEAIRGEYEIKRESSCRRLQGTVTWTMEVDGHSEGNDGVFAYSETFQIDDRIGVDVRLRFENIAGTEDGRWIDDGSTFVLQRLMQEDAVYDDFPNACHHEVHAVGTGASSGTFSQDPEDPVPFIVGDEILRSDTSQPDFGLLAVMDGTLTLTRRSWGSGRGSCNFDQTTAEQILFATGPVCPLDAGLGLAGHSEDSDTERTIDFTCSDRKTFGNIVFAVSGSGTLLERLPPPLPE